VIPSKSSRSSNKKSSKKVAKRVLKMQDQLKLREKPRAFISLPAIGWLGSAVDKHWIRLVDISQTGMRILDVDFDLKVGDVIHLWWRLMAGLPEIELSARVVWIKDAACGLAFVDVGKKEKILIEQFVRFHRSEI